MRQVIHAITTQEQRVKIAKTFQNIKSKIHSPAKSKSKIKKTLDYFEKPYRLHLGCGNVGIKDFCNVDIMETTDVDIEDDIRTLGKFPNESAKEIYACHVLEHFSHDEIVPILKRWNEILIPGGIIRISVPDLDRIVKIYADNPEHFNTPGHSPWIGLIYGGQSTPYDYHKTGFNFCWLKYILEQCNFERCQEYPHVPHFVPGVIDASVAKEPFGVYFSLNMMAIKPIRREPVS